MKLKSWQKWGLGIPILLLAGWIIYAENDHRAFFPPGDSWYHESPTDLLDWNHELPRSQFCVVALEKQIAAQALLETQAIAPLNSAQAQSFWNGNSAVPRGLRPFMVRGVFLNEATGGYGIYLLPQNKGIEVAHAAFGQGPFPMQRQALMVYLKEEPQQVFVTCSLAE